MCEYKICSKCKETLELSEFHKNKWQPDGLSHYCRVCKSHRAKEYKEKYPEKEASRKAKWYLNNRSYADAKTRNWVERNAEARKEIAKAYYYRNKPLCFAHSALRRARLLNAVPSWFDPKPVSELYKQARELSRNTGIKMAVDHIIPLKGALVCGLHVIDNLRIIPGVENSKKGNKFKPG